MEICVTDPARPDLHQDLARCRRGNGDLLDDAGLAETLDDCGLHHSRAHGCSSVERSRSRVASDVPTTPLAECCLPTHEARAWAPRAQEFARPWPCLLYTSDAADERS